MMAARSVHGLPGATSDKGFVVQTDDEGKFISQTVVYNGHIYSPWRSNFVDRLDQYKESFPVYDDDIYLVAYPKSGTHWLWEILMMLTRGSAELVGQNKLELMIEPGFDVYTEPGEGERPRVINSHLRPDDMPTVIMGNSRGKFIQIHRNPGDVAVSFFYHLTKAIKDSALAYNWDEYMANMFFNEKLMHESTWFVYTRDWSPYLKRDNFLSIYYEDLKEKPVEVISKVAEFIGANVSKQLIEEIAENTSFKKMKKDKESEGGGKVEVQSFAEGFSMYRKGIVGDWKNHFTEEQHEMLAAQFKEKMGDIPELIAQYRDYMAL